MALHLEMENYVLVFVVYYFFSCENIKELRDGHVKDGLSWRIWGFRVHILYFYFSR